MQLSGPPIKNGVDLQLQSACSDGNWPFVLRLAEKRARTSKDQYFEALKVCAESQLDDPSSTLAAVAAVWQYVEDGTVIRDVDALDLLEWACQDHLPDEKFGETLGTLRMRAVKAGVKNKGEAIRCLESCLLHWDLTNAQQIAATMDRTFSQDRKFMFWNIVITHMLSLSGQSPPEKKKLYGMLAQKQIERAAQAPQNGNDTTVGPEQTPARTVQTEEEVLLLHAVVGQHGSEADISKLAASPSLGPIAQFRKGRKELLLRTIDRHCRSADWQAVFDLCRQCLSESDSGEDDINFLAADAYVWKQFIVAASHVRHLDKSASKTVQDILLRFANSTSLRPIYRRNILLARLGAVFALTELDGPDVVDGQPASLRLKELVMYLTEQCINTACFDDVKHMIEVLDESALAWLAGSTQGELRSPSTDERGSACVDLLSFKIRFLVSTCRLTRESSSSKQKLCKLCDAEACGRPCKTCLSGIIRDALERFRHLRQGSPSGMSQVLSETAIVIALAYVEMAALSTYSPPAPETPSELIGAITILEEQLHDSPKDSVVLLLLVQLHLRIGSASRARTLWDGLGVKRTIVDCIAPVLYDRLSTVSPILLSSFDRRGAELSDCVKSHYETSLKSRMPRRLIDAFDAESYASILQIPDYIENLRNGCTRVMSLVEEARTARLIDGPGSRVLEDPRYKEISSSLQLCETIDFGSYPVWSVAGNPPVYEQLQLGPSPTSQRSHLSLLAEAFHEILSYKAPALYKVAATSDPTFIVEQLTQINHAISTQSASSKNCLTREESIYFDLLGLLSGFATLVASVDRSVADEAFPVLISTSQEALESLKASLIFENTSRTQTCLLRLSHLHGLTLLRDAAYATRASCLWILAHNEREKARDRSGQSGLQKEIVALVKRLQAESEEVTKFGKAWLKSLQDQVEAAEFVQNVQAQVGQDLEPLAASRAAHLIVQSWRATLKGWQEVRWS